MTHRHSAAARSCQTNYDEANFSPATKTGRDDNVEISSSSPSSPLARSTDRPATPGSTTSTWVPSMKRGPQSPVMTRGRPVSTGGTRFSMYRQGSQSPRGSRDDVTMVVGSLDTAVANIGYENGGVGKGSLPTDEEQSAWEKELLSMANFGEETAKSCRTPVDLNVNISVEEIFDVVGGLDSGAEELLSKQTFDLSNLSLPTSDVSSSASASIKFDETKRSSYANEIMSLQQRYVALLRTGLNELLKALLAEESKVASSTERDERTPNEKKLVLKDFEKILALHEAFISDLALHLNDPMIGQYLLNKTAPWKSVYSLYVTRNLVLNMDISTDPRLTDGTPQENFLQEPLTHLYKFCDLAFQLLQQTPQEHPDYLSTITLYTRTLSVADRVTTLRVTHLIFKYSGPPLTRTTVTTSSKSALPSTVGTGIAQTLVRHGPTQVNSKKQHMFLFDHTLVITKPQSSQKSFLGKLGSSSKVPPPSSTSVCVTSLGGGSATSSGSGVGGGSVTGVVGVGVLGVVFPTPPPISPSIPPRSTIANLPSTPTSGSGTPPETVPSPHALSAAFSGTPVAKFEFVQAVELFRCALDVGNGVIGTGTGTCTFTIVTPGGRLAVVTTSTSDRDSWVSDFRRLIAGAIEDQLDDSERKQDKTILQKKREEYVHVEAQRKQVMRTIAKSETEYLLALHDLHNGLRVVTEKVLLSDSLTVNQKQLKPFEQLYSDATRILKLHEEIHTLLTLRESEWETKTTICDIFTDRLSAFSEAYLAYTTKFCEKIRNLTELISACPGVSQEKLKQQLIQPVHRISQYRTFLQEMVSVTPPTHYDYSRLANVTQKLQELSTTIILTASTFSKCTSVTAPTPDTSSQSQPPTTPTTDTH
ncbi:hypothetical protein Pelo_18269 [Pelomyxa schiedti]|nr:hypothetical protein Pelo_18269 [Pelomyxa schiedti]